MSFMDELDQIERSGIEERNRQSSYTTDTVDFIILAVKNTAKEIARSGGKHRISGVFGGNSECPTLIYTDTEYPAHNFAWELNHGRLKVNDLKSICAGVETELIRLGFKRVSVYILSEHLDEAESHPANIKRIGYPAAPKGLFQRMKTPLKYFIHVDCRW